MNDEIKHPTHYTKYSVEVIDITRYLPFCLGNVVKYVLRAPYKDSVKDCDKALQYLEWCSGPVVMRVCDSARLRHNIREMRDDLESSEIRYERLQGRFLTLLWDVVSGCDCEILRFIINDIRGLLAK